MLPTRGSLEAVLRSRCKETKVKLNKVRPCPSFARRMDGDNELFGCFVETSDYPFRYEVGGIYEGQVGETLRCLSIEPWHQMVTPWGQQGPDISYKSERMSRGFTWATFMVVR